MLLHDPDITSIKSASESVDAGGQITRQNNRIVLMFTAMRITGIESGRTLRNWQVLTTDEVSG